MNLMAVPFLQELVPVLHFNFGVMESKGGNHISQIHWISSLLKKNFAFRDKAWKNKKWRPTSLCLKDYYFVLFVPRFLPQKILYLLNVADFCLKRTQPMLTGLLLTTESWEYILGWTLHMERGRPIDGASEQLCFHLPILSKWTVKM